jgi:hypothetical protein
MKNKCLYKSKNQFRIFIVSNNKTPVIISTDDRRYFVIYSSNKLRQNRSYFGKYYDECLGNRKWVQSLYSELMDMDLDNFDVGNRPKTQAFERMKSDNLRPIHYYLRYLTEKTEYKNDWIVRPKYENEVAIEPTKLYLKYKCWLDNNQYDINKFSQRDVLKDLRCIPNIEVDSKVKYNSKTIRVFKFKMDKIKKYLEKEVFTIKEEIEEW